MVDGGTGSGRMGVPSISGYMSGGKGFDVIMGIFGPVSGDGGREVTSASETGSRGRDFETTAEVSRDGSDEGNNGAAGGSGDDGMNAWRVCEGSRAGFCASLSGTSTGGSAEGITGGPAEGIAGGSAEGMAGGTLPSSMEGGPGGSEGISDGGSGREGGSVDAGDPTPATEA